MQNVQLEQQFLSTSMLENRPYINFKIIYAETGGDVHSILKSYIEQIRKLYGGNFVIF